MRFLVMLALLLKLFHVENRMIKDVIKPVTEEADIDDQNDDDDNHHDHEPLPQEKVIGLKNNEEGDHDHEEDSEEIEKKISPELKKHCAIVVLSNVQNADVRSLLRKYRYDADGVLIPSSVRYFIKLPQHSKSEPILVPLNDKAFSPMGGFVRYYKEVPPIPRNW